MCKKIKNKTKYLLSQWVFPSRYVRKLTLLADYSWHVYETVTCAVLHLFIFISYLKNEWKWQEYQEELLNENVFVHALMLNNTDICNKN